MMLIITAKLTKYYKNNVKFDKKSYIFMVHLKHKYHSMIPFCEKLLAVVMAISLKMIVYMVPSRPIVALLYTRVNPCFIHDNRYFYVDNHPILCFLDYCGAFIILFLLITLDNYAQILYILPFE